MDGGSDNAAKPQLARCQVIEGQGIPKATCHIGKIVPFSRRAPSSMASQPMQVWRQGNPRVPKGREIAGADADLNSIVDVQLVAKTNRLSISEAGTAAETPTGEANGLRPLNMASVETLCPPGFDNQQYVATKGEWQDNILAESPVATTVAVTSDAPQPLEATAASRTQLAENFNAVRMTAAVPQRKTQRQLLDLPNEVLFHILSYLEVCDLLATSRVRLTFLLSFPLLRKTASSLVLHEARVL